jgi:uncharacterized membrane protein YbhN (UPF0104 family)
MPGMIGADVVKFFYLKKHDQEMPSVQLALILTLDRILGLVAVLVWCSFFSLFIKIPEASKDARSIYLFVYLPFALLIAGGIGLVALEITVRTISQFKLPSIIHELIRTYQLLVRSYDRKSLVLMMTYNLLAVFILLAGLVYIGGKLQIQQHSEPMVALQFFLIPLVLVSSMLPLTPMGLGVAQITMAGAYDLFGLNPSVGVSISTLSQLALLFVSVVIGGAFFFGAKSIVMSSSRHGLQGK